MVHVCTKIFEELIMTKLPLNIFFFILHLRHINDKIKKTVIWKWYIKYFHAKLLYAYNDRQKCYIMALSSRSDNVVLVDVQR